MTGYRMVFDRENLKLAWSRSNCEFSFLSIDIKEGSNLPSVMWFASGGDLMQCIGSWNQSFHLEFRCQQLLVCVV